MTNQKKAKQAFTLIEIMVASVIMIILVGLVIQITSGVLTVWNRASGDMAANAEARIAMDFITRDLETAVFRKNGQQWLRVEGPEALDADAPFDSQTVALKLFSPALDRDMNSEGDICGIAYRLEYQEAYENADLKVYALYRAIETPENTFRDLLGVRGDADSPQLSLDESAPGVPDFWGTSNIIEQSNFLATNIVNFKILVYGQLTDDDGNTTRLLLNADANDFQLNDDYAFGGEDETEVSDVIPDLLYADVMLTVVSDEGLKLLQAIDEGVAGIDADEVIRQHSQDFIRRVNFAVTPF